MSFLRWYFLLLAMSWACQAAEVIAWKIPLVNYCQFGLEEGAAVRMKDAPEASVFFNEGDELWDVSKEGPAPGKLPDLDWIVWNGSSGRLIA